MKLSAERLTLEDTPEALSELFYRKGWTDGLPIIPPTPVRVERMLEGWSLDPSHSLGLIPPSYGEATLEKVAINAVIAGCLPFHLPLVVAGVEAMLDPAFNLNAVQCTTSATAPLLLFNGPVRREAQVNCESNAFGVGGRSNAVIGRAIRLILLAIGGAVPGEIDKASLGQPGKLAFCFGENEEDSPWEPYHVENGFRAEESTVTVIGVTGSNEVVDSTSPDGEGVLKTMAHSITSAAFVAACNSGVGGQALVVFTPEHARKIQGHGFSKSAVKEWLWREARRSLHDFPREVVQRIQEWRRSKKLPEDGEVHVTPRPEDILVVVAGGAGVKSAFVPTWGGALRSVTRPIPRRGSSGYAR